MNHAVTLLDSGAGYLMLFATGTRRLEVRNHVTLGSDFPASLEGSVFDLDAGRDATLAHSILREVAVSGISQICNDANRVSPFGKRNLIAVPIFRREILGVLVVCDKAGWANVSGDFVDEDRILPRNLRPSNWRVYWKTHAFTTKLLKNDVCKPRWKKRQESKRTCCLKRSPVSRDMRSPD